MAAKCGVSSCEPGIECSQPALYLVQSVRHEKQNRRPSTSRQPGRRDATCARWATAGRVFGRHIAAHRTWPRTAPPPAAATPRRRNARRTTRRRNPTPGRTCPPSRRTRPSQTTWSDSSHSCGGESRSAGLCVSNKSDGRRQAADGRRRDAQPTRGQTARGQTVRGQTAGHRRREGAPPRGGKTEWPARDARAVLHLLRAVARAVPANASLDPSATG
jgi:hypothetical protein